MTVRELRARLCDFADEYEVLISYPHPTAPQLYTWGNLKDVAESATGRPYIHLNVAEPYPEENPVFHGRATVTVKTDCPPTAHRGRLSDCESKADPA